MRILKIEPGKVPEVTQIDNTLKAMQEVVGGLIQAIYPFDDPELVLICNEEGKLLDLPMNRSIRDMETGKVLDIVFGTFFLCSAPKDLENFSDLTKEQLNLGLRLFSQPECFLPCDGGILIFKENLQWRKRKWMNPEL